MISVLAHLGYGFLRANLAYPFLVGRGKARFLRLYTEEGLFPVSAEFRLISASFERCIGCGLCELELPEPLDLRALACSRWRSPESWPALSEQLEQLAALDLTAAEAICPGEVPLGRLVLELRAALDKWFEAPVESSRAAT